MVVFGGDENVGIEQAIFSVQVFCVDLLTDAFR